MERLSDKQPSTPSKVDSNTELKNSSKGVKARKLISDSFRKDSASF